MSNFDRCLAVTLKWEGGYSDHPDDNGGKTMMGITHHTLSRWLGRPVNEDDMRALTKEQATKIYRDWYWDAVRADHLPPGLDLVAFDGAVHAGAAQSAKWLQRALGVKDDGIVGPKTVEAAHKADVRSAIHATVNSRMRMLQSLSDWGVFGRGWAMRLDDIRATALRMAPAPASPPSQRQATKTAGAGLLAALWRLLTGGKA